MIFRLLIALTVLAPLAIGAGDSLAVESDLQVKRSSPIFGRERLRGFVLGNFDRFARLNQSLPALSEDAVRVQTESFRPEDVTIVLESFAGLFPGPADEKTDNVIQILIADHLSAEISQKISTVNPQISELILSGIEDGTLCWSGKLPTPEKDIPLILVSQKADAATLSTCLYRSVMAQMGVLSLYKDLYPADGKLNAILSHMANVTVMHLFFECRAPIRAQDFKQGRRCMEARFDERY